MGPCGFSEGAEGEMVYTLTSLQKMKPVELDDLDGWDSRIVLDMIAKKHPKFDQPLHALIDCGALVTGAPLPLPLPLPARS